MVYEIIGSTGENVGLKKIILWRAVAFTHIDIFVTALQFSENI
jgi:hypothetical protein